VDRNTSRMPEYSAIERWKGESFHDSPWNDIDHNGRIGFESATPVSGHENVEMQLHDNSNSRRRQEMHL
jgi:hypothetical protein